MKCIKRQKLIVNFRAQIWLIACGREDLLHKGVNLFKYKICSAHFEKKHFNVYRLKSDAVPTLFPTMESSSLAEHSYCQAINDSNNVQGRYYMYLL